MRTVRNFWSAAGVAALAAAAGLIAPGAHAVAESPWTERARLLMGTLCDVRAPGDPAVVGPALDAALDRIAELEAVLTTWRPDGELARLNAACAAASGPVAVSPALENALRTALAWAERTAGEFDPTVGALADAWGLQSGGREPKREEIARALAMTGWGRAHRALAGRTLRCAEGGPRFDLGGIGKGIALDAAADELRRRGVGAALFNFGGQVLALGHPPGAPAWLVDIADPERRDAPAVVIALRDASVATSGNAERAIRVAGRDRGHLIDPRTGEPVDTRAAVSVVASDATSADALSTALLVAGLERAAPLARAAGGAEYLFLERRPGGTLVVLATSPHFPRIP